MWEGSPEPEGYRSISTASPSGEGSHNGSYFQGVTILCNPQYYLLPSAH